MVKVYTSQFRYSGTDSMDITARNKTAFSPTWRMVNDFKTGKISQIQYSDMYAELMRESFLKNHPAWRDLLRMHRVTFVCYCIPGNFCHRVLLAGYLEILGAEYGGEIK